MGRTWFGALCLMLSPTLAFPEPETWRSHINAGMVEYQRAGHAKKRRAFHQAKLHYGQAETWLTAALREAETFPQPDHRVSVTLNYLSWVYLGQRQYAAAEAVLRRALAIDEELAGAIGYQGSMATTLDNLKGVYFEQGRYGDAEVVAERSLELHERAFGTEHLALAKPLEHLVKIHFAQGQYMRAELFIKRQLAIQERALGPKHSRVGTTLENYAAILRRLNRVREAAEMEARARAIPARRPGTLK